MEIVIASKNLHKIREIKAILKPQFAFDFLSLLDFPDYQPPEETGSTFEENAFIKATHAAEALRRWVIADDSGLVVPALEDAPGIKSARYAGEGASDKENRQKLIKALDPIKESERTCYYVCALALASSDGIQMQVKGLCEGSLILNPRGSQGFGYDPLFLKYDYNKTFAEIDEETKNKISHRRKALDKLTPILETLLVSK
ncbi:MAG: RdgB/HAM1 family non-canonical purine NTP pyrophosphatase [Simkaniaceae bacterium]|jgi:XTP/dITP diphosphohydrolase|nr:MAG: RdgB/HAM1 family non-canonical purine NTP pyrophosphatase [Simkaniaceae bacterium]